MERTVKPSVTRMIHLPEGRVNHFFENSQEKFGGRGGTDSDWRPEPTFGPINMRPFFETSHVLYCSKIFWKPRKMIESDNKILKRWSILNLGRV